MPGFGTLINCLLILVGGLIGLFFGKKISERIRQTVTQATGVAVMFIGIGGTLSRMLTLTDGRFSADGTVMMVVCLVLGAVIGELLNLAGLVTLFGEWLKRKAGSTGDPRFTDAFVTASCTFCVGAMAVMGSLEDGMNGNYTILLTKGILDGIICCIMAASIGKGCIFSLIPVGLLQGSLTLVGVFVGDALPAAATDALSYVGSVLIFCVGINLLLDTKTRIVNLLPAIPLAMLWAVLF